MKDIATDIAIALITGFVASFFYEKFVAWRRYHELKAGFEWLHGRYARPRGFKVSRDSMDNNTHVPGSAAQTL